MRFVRIWVGTAIAAAALPLAGCSHVPDAVNPVAWYRDAAGTSHDDAQDVNQRNQQNLEAGSKQPYPNLATVPNAPSQATSTIDRDKLVQGLIADRANAKYNNEQLQAGSQLASIAPPPPPVKLNSPGTPATATVNPPSGAAASPASATTTRGSQQPPAESTLASPTVPVTPQGQVPAPPPPAPEVARTSPPPAPAIPSVAPGAPPAAPHLTPPAGVRAGGQPSLAMRTPAKAQNPISVSVGDVAFAQGSSDLAETQRGALAEIAGLYKQTGGDIRIVGHSEPGHSNDAIRQRIAGLDLALDRANAVAQALAKMGVPAHNIRVEAAPAGAQEQPRAEVFMEY
ncbi:MAG: OmpA family protein [Alphaproteobacteria bacterium]|nr:OmpA family protein [Alphaproteobacteria bacterium]